MGWRKKMGVEAESIFSNPNSNNSNIRNTQEKDPPNPNIAIIADIAPKNQKVKSRQQQFDSLWKKAWALADWIDNSSSDVPWQERAARVPELQEMSAEIGRLETLTEDSSPVSDIPDWIEGDIKKRKFRGVSNPSKIDLSEFSLLSRINKSRPNKNNCPARCKRTGKCYGISYFDAKPGEPLLCMIDKCPWPDQLKQYSRWS